MPVYLQRLEPAGGQPVAPGGEALRATLRGDLHTHSDWSDGGSPIEEMAAGGPCPRPRLHRADRPFAPADRGQRADRAASARPAADRRRHQRAAGPVPHPDRHRGRHQRGRLARPGPGPAGVARHRGRVGAFEAADAGRGDDPPDGPRGREPGRRHPGALHGPHGRRDAAGPSRSSTPTWSSRPAAGSGWPSR